MFCFNIDERIQHGSIFGEVMNNWLKIVIALAGLLLVSVCCGEKTRQMEGKGSSAHAALAEIDSLMWQRADSAFVLLQEFVVGPEVEELDTFDGHYCQVLISELLYKNDCEQTNREDLLKALRYFDSLIVNKHDANKREVVVQKQNVFLDARAHYINGVGYYELGNVVQACSEYLKALEVMEEHFEEKKLVGDCVVRSITKLLNKDWDSVYLMLAMQGYALKDMPSAVGNYSASSR